MDLKLVDDKGSLSVFEAPDFMFSKNFNEPLIHQVLTAVRANLRLGTRSQKDRSEVSHSTRKPWRQKGTGRARAGMTSSPLWRGGGKIFPASPDENFSQKINKKMYRAAMCAVLSQLAREDRILILETLFRLQFPKTKEAVKKLLEFGLNQNITTLIVSNQVDENVHFAIRNLPFVSVITPSSANPVILIRHQKILITKEAVNKLGEILR